MITFTLADAARILGIASSNHQTTFTGISIDTRTLVPGNLFIALSGTQVDGHDFIDDAAANGAAALLVSRPVSSSLPQLLVRDVVDALGKLAAEWRQTFTLPLIAITGSNGKTTVKNMVASILTAACHQDKNAVLATLGTFNNHLGLPLTLARLNATHRYAVIEMGMNHFGEIAYLTQLAKPTVAVITNAAAAHLEGLGDIAGVARAKAEIFQGLSTNSTAILNRDDDFFSYWQKQTSKFTIISFGKHPEATIRAIPINTSPASGAHFSLQTPQGNIDIQLPLLGEHNIQNALAAASCALAVNISLETIKSGLEQLQAAPGRLQLHTLQNGVHIIDDTYNANPFSLQAAAMTLASFPGKRIFVLGDMKELGNDTENLHHIAGEALRNAGIDYLFTYGNLSEHTACGFGKDAYHFNEQDKLIRALKPFLHNQTTILVKGSRSMHMEKIITELVNGN